MTINSPLEGLANSVMLRNIYDNQFTTEGISQFCNVIKYMTINSPLEGLANSVML